MREFKYIVLVGMLCGLVSCGTFNNFIGKPDASAPVAKKEQSSARQAKTSKEAQKSNNDRAMHRFFNKKKENHSEKSVPQSNEGIKKVDERASRPPLAPDNTGTKAPVKGRAVNVKSAEIKAISDHLNGEWMFENAWGKSVPGEDDHPSIIFEASKTRFYAFNGCNYLNGDYNVVSSDALKFENTISTQQYCVDMPQASELTALLNQTRYFKITAVGSEEYMELMNDKKQKIGTLRRHCLEALNGMWEVESVGSARIDRRFPPTLVIDLIEKRIHGHSGCNLFNGSIYQDPDKDVSVQFQGMKVSKMNCSTVDLETALLVALEKVEMAKLEGDTRATLCDGNGNPLITLVRTDL